HHARPARVAALEPLHGHRAPGQRDRRERLHGLRDEPRPAHADDDPVERLHHASAHGVGHAGLRLLKMIANEPAAFTAAPVHLKYRACRRNATLVVLSPVALYSYLDRHVVSVLLEPIKKEFGVSDTQLGLLTGFAFAIFYAGLGIPVARWADTGN